MFKKMVVSVLVFSMFVVPTLALAGEGHLFVPATAEAVGETFTAGDDMALLLAAVKGDASFEAVALSLQEMEEIEAASRFSRWRRANRAQFRNIVIQLAIIAACVAVTGSTAGAGIGTCTVAF